MRKTPTPVFLFGNATDLDRNSKCREKWNGLRPSKRNSSRFDNNYKRKILTDRVRQRLNSSMRV